MDSKAFEDGLTAIGGLVHIGLALAAIIFFLVGLFAAFHTSVITGLIFFFIPALSTFNGIFMMFGYSLSDNVAQLLHIN